MKPVYIYIYIHKDGDVSRKPPLALLTLKMTQLRGKAAIYTHAKRRQHGPSASTKHGSSASIGDVSRKLPLASPTLKTKTRLRENRYIYEYIYIGQTRDPLGGLYGRCTDAYGFGQARLKCGVKLAQAKLDSEARDKGKAKAADEKDM